MGIPRYCSAAPPLHPSIEEYEKYLDLARDYWVNGAIYTYRSHYSLALKQRAKILEQQKDADKLSSDVFLTIASTLATASFMAVFGEITLPIMASAMLAKIAESTSRAGLKAIASGAAQALDNNKAVIFVAGKLQDAALGQIKSATLQAFAHTTTAINPSPGIMKGFNAEDAGEVENQMKKVLNNLVMHAKVQLRSFDDSLKGRTPKEKALTQNDIYNAIEIMWHAPVMFPPDTSDEIDPNLVNRMELVMWLAEIASTGKYVEKSDWSIADKDIEPGYGRLMPPQIKTTQITQEKFPNGLPPVDHGIQDGYDHASKEIYIDEVGDVVRDHIIQLYNDPTILTGVVPLSKHDFVYDRASSILHKIEVALKQLPSMTIMDKPGLHITCLHEIKPNFGPGS